MMLALADSDWPDGLQMLAIVQIGSFELTNWQQQIELVHSIVVNWRFV